jgi:hypothetical protein
MVATTKVRFLVGANYGVDFKKISSPVKPTGVQGFSKPGEAFFFFFMKTVGTVLPHRPSFKFGHGEGVGLPSNPFGLAR